MAPRSECNWYAIQTRQFGEDLACEHLGRLGICTFLPRIRVEHSVCGVDRLVIKPLFSRYLFAFFDLQHSSQAVRSTPRVVRVLGNGQVPLPISPEIIQNIRERIQPDGYVRLARTEPRCGDKVTLTRGCFAGWMGRVERECDDRKRVLILLESLHQSWLVVDRRFTTMAASDA